MTDLPKSTSGHFVCLPSGIKPEESFSLMTEGLALPWPDLVVSVVGSEVPEEAWMKDVLKELVEVARYQKVWILKDGRRDNVGPCLKEALEDLKMSSYVSVIGVAPWSLLQNTQLCLNGEAKGSCNKKAEEPLSFKREAEPAPCTPRGNKEELYPVPRVEEIGPQHHRLDNNCKAVLLVPNGEETEFQICLEEYISYQKQSGSSVCIEVLSILISGEAIMLQRVDQSLKKKIPWLVQEDAGPAAKLISEKIKDPKRKSDEPTSEPRQMVVTHSPDEKNIEIMLESIYSNKHWITVCNVEQRELKKVIRKAMPKGNMHFHSVRRQVDRATEEVSEAIKWTTKDLEDLMTEALDDNNPEFVAFYLDRGLNINEYMTYKRLERLYGEIKDCLLSELLQEKIKRCQFKQVNDDIESDRFSSQTIEAVSCLLEDIFKGVCDPSFPLVMFGLSTDEAEPVRQDGRMRGDIIWASLFIWAVLQNKEEMFYLCLKRAEERLLCALCGCKILKELSKKTNKSDIKRTLTEQSKKLELWACDFFHEMYQTRKTDDKHSNVFTILRKMSPFWGGATCLQMAKAAQARKFMSHDGAQALLSMVWWGGMEDSTSLWKLMVTFLIPPVMYTNLISFSSSTASCKAPPTTETTERGGATRSTGPQKPTCCICTTPFVVRRFMQFYSAPATVFLFNVVMYFLFLGLFAYVLLVDFKSPRRDGLSMPEMVLYFWVFTLLCEEMRQAFEPKHTVWSAVQYVKDWWNLWDLTAILLCIVAICFRMFQATYDSARVTLALDYMVFTLRVIHIFSGSRQLGPKIIMVRKMVKDLFFFLLFLGVWLLAYGVANHTLVFPYDTHPTNIMQQVFYMPYMILFGEIPSHGLDRNMAECTTNLTLIYAGTMEPCVSTFANWLVTPLMLLFLLVINILLVNLLIAMFSDTFSKVHADNDVHWKFQCYGLVEEYNSRPCLAPPFIIISHIIIIIRKICCRTSKHSSSREESPTCHIKETVSKSTLQLSKMLKEDSDLRSWENDFLTPLENKKKDRELVEHILQLILDHRSSLDEQAE